MPRPLSRRNLLAAAGGLSLSGLLGRLALPAQAEELSFGPAEPFDFALLKARAQALAAEPYRETPQPLAALLETIDYDAYQKIRFNPASALWAESGPFPVQFFHLGRYFKLPVRIYVLADGEAREILYDARYFRFGDRQLARLLPPSLGFAGFRLMQPGEPPRDWLVFLGASYFRSSGELDQYGLSARGIAIDSGLATPEEFPRFTHFWLEKPAAGADSIAVNALLDGPSITGAYRFLCSKHAGVVMDVEAELFLRRGVKRLGLAPLTSMFWFAENNRHQATDWRPEIHDSDGLAIWTGSGERIWRPLIDPPGPLTTSYLDRSPKGFGLLQRDRNFDHYQDDGVFYNRRPSLWVEPMGDWGPGAVQLVELHTDDEIHDNIVAYWLPERPAEAGTRWSLAYRLHWLAEEPYPSKQVGRVLHSRIGRGGVPGQPRPEGLKKFVVDFGGGPLEGLTREAEIEAVVTASRGTVSGVYVLQVVGTKHWRAVFDLMAEGAEPVDLRLFLRHGEATLSETWLYHFIPFEF